MRFLSLLKLPSSRNSINRLGGLRLHGGSTTQSLLVYFGVFDAFIAGNPNDAVHVSGVHGDGRDGVVHYTADTTLLADVRATRIIVDEGVTVRQNGFLQVANVAILNNGTIHDDGIATDHETTNTSGVAGGNPSSTGPQGASSRNSFGTPYTFETLGAKGGDGGGTGHRFGGDNSVDWTIVSNVISPFATNNPTDVQRFEFAQQVLLTLTVGCGGGRGGSVDAGDGGHGARMVRLRAPQIVNNGIIRARGENGQDGTGPNDDGGGGGGGGRLIIYGRLLVPGTLDVSGGRGGVGNGTGVDGEPGEDGTIHLFGN